MKKLAVLLLAGLLLLTACGKHSSSQPSPSATVSLTGAGNTNNDGYVCSDGAGGIYYTNYELCTLIHRTAAGKSETVTGLQDAAMMQLRDGKVYLLADKGKTEEGTSKEFGLYVIDKEPKLLSGANITYFQVTDKLYYSTDEGLFVADLDGKNAKKLTDMDVRQFAIGHNQLFVYGLADEQGTIYSMNLDGTNQKMVATEASGNLNVTEKGVYFLGQDGAYYMEYGQEPRQVIYAEGISGLNALADGRLYYVSSSLEEPSINLLKSEEPTVIVAPSVLGDIQESPIIVNNKLYFVSQPDDSSAIKLFCCDLDGKNIQAIATDG